VKKLKISEIYYDKFKEDPMFFGSHWDVTSRCNYRCSYCTYKNRDEEWYPYEHMLKIIEFYDSLYENYNLSLMLFGGEPLKHPDILKIIERLGKSIYPLQVFTNLSRSTTVLKEICSIRDDLKFFCSYHHEYADYDIFRERVDLLRDMGAQVHVKVMWDSIKKDETKAIYEKFSDHVRTIDMIYHPNQSFTEEDKDWYIEEHKKTDLNRYYVDGDMLSYHEVKVRMDGIANFQGYHCEAGRRNLMVCSNGDVYPCLTYRKVGQPLFNLIQDIYFVPHVPTKCNQPECYSEIGIPKFKIKEPKMVCLVLGEHCNWDCGYCDRPKIEKPKRVNLKLLHQFYPRIIEWANDVNVHISGGETALVDKDALDFVFNFDKKLIVETNGMFFHAQFDKYNSNIQKIVYHCVPELDMDIEWYDNNYVDEIEYLIVVHHKNIHLLRDFIKKYDKKFTFQYYYPKFLRENDEYLLTREDYFTLIRDFPDMVDKREIIKRISPPDNIDELRKECVRRFDFVGFDFVNGRIKFCKQSHSFTNYVELNEENFDLLVRDKLVNEKMDEICKTCTEVVRYF